MSKTKVIVRTHPQLFAASEQSVMLSDSIVKRWRIPTHQTIHLRFGSARLPVRVVAISARSEMRLSGPLAQQLGLPHQPIPLRIAYRPQSRSIKIGPLLGVMVPLITQTPGRRFGIITSFCRELTEAGRAEGAFVYFFTTDDLRSSQDKIEGWSLNGQEYRASFPVPNVIYNRLPSRKLDSKPGLQEFLRSAKAKWHTSVFNEKYLDKTEVFQALRRHGAAARYLPESHAFRGSGQLKSMLSRYRTVFLKPITGSLGKGIIRIARSPGGGYLAGSSTATGVEQQRYASMSSLLSALSGKAKSGRYLIQQGLDLISIGGRPVDFRALVQKTLTGQWSVTSTVARTAGNNRFVSNIAQGGVIGPVRSTVAKSNLAGAAKHVPGRLERAALAISKGIEATIPYHYGELGVDLAVDRGGRVWLLEVNAKPSKNDSSLLGSGKIRPSVKQLVQYARFLSNL